MELALILIGLLAFFAVGTSIGTPFFSMEQKEELKNEKIPLPKKIVKLISENGDILLEYTDVYLDHWDKSIYYLSYEYEYEYNRFLRIDKGENMLLLAEN